MCLPTCQHGPMLTDASPAIWDCTALGGRTPGLAQASPDVQVASWVPSSCSKDFDNCTATMCCQTPTYQCYKKDKSWSACLRGCVKGPHEYDSDDTPWSCEQLGPRTPRPWAHPSLYCLSVARIWSP